MTVIDFFEKDCFDVETIEKCKQLDIEWHEEWVEEATFVEHHSLLFPTIGQAKRQRKVCEGDRRVKKMNEMLDSILLPFHRRRNVYQIAYHESYMIASLPKIYEKDWVTQSSRLLKEYGIKRVNPFVLAIAPRRVGKTLSIAVMVAVLLLVVLGIKVAAFSTGERASGLVMEEVIKLLNATPEYKSRIVKANNEQLHLAPPGAASSGNSGQGKSERLSHNTSTFSSFPSNPVGQTTFRHIDEHSDRQQTVDRQAGEMKGQAIF